MTDFLLDTNALSELVSNPDGPLATRCDSQPHLCCTSIIAVAEMRFGVAKKRSERLRLQVEVILSSIRIEPWSEPADLHYAELRAHLERQGTPIGGNDMLIAAHALALDATLVSANQREFARVPGLRVEDWTA